VRLVVATRTGVRRPIDATPGLIGDVGAGAALVAAADEWIRLERIEHEGVSLTPDEIVRPGDRFESGT
jgi:hypothetical protein